MTQSQFGNWIYGEVSYWLSFHCTVVYLLSVRVRVFQNIFHNEFVSYRMCSLLQHRERGSIKSVTTAPTSIGYWLEYGWSALQVVDFLKFFRMVSFYCFHFISFFCCCCFIFSSGAFTQTWLSPRFLRWSFTLHHKWISAFIEQNINSCSIPTSLTCVCACFNVSTKLGENTHTHTKKKR